MARSRALGDALRLARQLTYLSREPIMTTFVGCTRCCPGNTVGGVVTTAHGCCFRAEAALAIAEGNREPRPAPRHCSPGEVRARYA